MKKIKFWWMFGVLAVILVIVRFVPYTKYIDQSYEGIEWRVGDKDYTRDINIHVKGYYSYYVFKANNFKGEITIDEYDFTTGKYYNTDLPSDYEGTLMDSEFNLFGMISCSAFYKDIMIRIYEDTENENKWSTHRGLLISAPAGNRDEAVNLSKKMKMRIHWLRVINWLDSYD